MSKKSGKSKMITPTSDSKADSDFEEDTRQALAASRGQQVTTNTDPSEAGPSNLEQTSSPATTESVMFGPPTLGDIVDQVFSSVRSTAHQRRELDKQGQKIVKKDTKNETLNKRQKRCKMEPKWSPNGPNIEPNWSKLDLKWKWNGFGIHSESVGNQLGTHTEFVWN